MSDKDMMMRDAKTSNGRGFRKSQDNRLAESGLVSLTKTFSYRLPKLLLHNLDTTLDRPLVQPTSRSGPYFFWPNRTSRSEFYALHAYHYCSQPILRYMLERERVGDRDCNILPTCSYRAIHAFDWGRRPWYLCMWTS